MGDKNQLTYLKNKIPNLTGSVLEIGSKDYGSTASFRSVYSNCEYIGVDMESGKGVDMIIDLVEGVGSLPKSHFDLIVCCSVLEHVRKPWVFAQHISQLSKIGGYVYISVPWVWRYHAYPDDYFRFSWRGIMELFPDFEWSQMEYSTNVEGEFIPITNENIHADDLMANYQRTGFLKKEKRKYLPYLMINMVGIKNSEYK